MYASYSRVNTKTVTIHDHERVGNFNSTIDLRTQRVYLHFNCLLIKIGSQELQRGGVRLNEVADTLERLLPRKQEPEPMAQQTPERLTNQFNRLRMRYGKYY